MAAAALRTLAYGFLSVILGLYLDERGLDVQAIGAVFTAALAGGAAMTLVQTAVADRLGRRRLLLLGALLMAGAGAVFVVSDSVWVLIVAAIVGTISPSGKEVGPFLSLEQAIVPQTTSDAERTSAFAFYNMIGLAAGAVGALLVGVPVLLGMPTLLGYQALVWAYAATGLLLLFLYNYLTSAVEAAPAAMVAESARTPVRPPVPAVQRPRFSWGLDQSRGIVLRLAALFSLDAFAGGFVVQGVTAYWFHLRYGVDAAGLGAIFFGAQMLSALSFFAAVPLARRVGLLRTMVFTHLPSNVLLVLVPLMPDLGLAVAMLLVRHLLSQMDVPTRQSYTMAVVAPEERAAAAGLTSVARNAAAAAAPVFASATLAVPALGLPFLIAGGLKIVYDLAIYAVFRNVRPPEETRG